MILVCILFFENLDCETDPRDVHSCVLTALVTAMALL